MINRFFGFLIFFIIIYELFCTRNPDENKIMKTLFHSRLHSQEQSNNDIQYIDIRFSDTDIYVDIFIDKSEHRKMND